MISVTTPKSSPLAWYTLVKTGVTYRENSVHKTDDAKLAAPKAKAFVVSDGSQEEQQLWHRLFFLQEDGGRTAAVAPADEPMLPPQVLFRTGGTISSFEPTHPATQILANYAPDFSLSGIPSRQGYSPWCGGDAALWRGVKRAPRSLGTRHSSAEI